MGIIAGAISKGLSLFKLNKATAIEGHVLAGETFYARSKDIRKGTLKNCGQYQTGGWGSGTVNGWNYYAINALPEGAYFSSGQSWAPEARVSQDTVHNFFGGNRGAWKGVSYGDAVAIPRGIHDGNGYVSIDGGNRGAWGTSIAPGASVAIPRGWHNGTGYVSANRATAWYANYMNDMGSENTLNYSHTFTGANALVIIVVADRANGDRAINNVNTPTVSNGTVSGPHAINLKCYSDSSYWNTLAKVWLVTGITGNCTVSVTTTTWSWGYGVHVFQIN